MKAFGWDSCAWPKRPVEAEEGYLKEGLGVSKRETIALSSIEAVEACLAKRHPRNLKVFLEAESKFLAERASMKRLSSTQSIHSSAFSQQFTVTCSLAPRNISYPIGSGLRSVADVTPSNHRIPPIY